MKLVTFEVTTLLGPFLRIGALSQNGIVDLNMGYASYLSEKRNPRHAHDLADEVLPPDMLAFLRVVDDPERSTDLYAVATGAPYRLGGLDLTSILSLASRRRRSLWSVLCEVEAQPGVLRGRSIAGGERVVEAHRLGNGRSAAWFTGRCR